MKQFANDHFAVLVVLFVFVLLFVSYMYQIRHNGTAENLDWLEGEMKEIVGAILMGLTGARINQVIQGGNSATPKTDEAVIPGATLPTYPKQ